MLSPDAHLDLLEREVAAMTAVLERADPATAVPGCPGWTARELAGHLIGVHRWVLAALDADAPPPFDDTPPDGDLAGSYAEPAGRMLSRLRELPPEHACWTLDRHNPTAAFWRRRQLHEISVHRWDLEPHAVSDLVGEDGVDEVVELMLPRQLGRGRAALPPGTLQLVSPGRTWRIGSGDPVSTVEGSAGELALALWGRGGLLPPEWRAAGLTP